MGFESFDFLSYFDRIGLEYWTEGKNVTAGWVAIQCLWCSDTSNHLGINIKSKRIKCWKCKQKGIVTHVIQKLEKCSRNEAEQIIEQYQDPLFSFRFEEREVGSKVGSSVLPSEATEDFPDLHYDYLITRNFSPEVLIPKYHLRAVYNLGKYYKYRLIIPVIMNQRIVGFTARDVSGKAKERYKQPPIERCLVHPRNWIYNFDNFKKRAIFLEGATDVWRMGDETAAFLGDEVSAGQISLLAQTGLQEAYFLFDPEPEAQELAKRFAHNLSGLVPKVEVISIDIEDDIANLNDNEALELKRYIFNG